MRTGGRKRSARLPGSPPWTARSSQIRFYLHRKGIDVVDWAGEDAVSGPGGAAAAAVNSAWFDMMPAYEGGTLRPALIADGKLLKKGMASAGRG